MLFHMMSYRVMLCCGGALAMMPNAQPDGERIKMDRRRVEMKTEGSSEVSCSQLMTKSKKGTGHEITVERRSEEKRGEEK